MLSARKASFQDTSEPLSASSRSRRSVEDRDGGRDEKRGTDLSLELLFLADGRHLLVEIRNLRRQVGKMLTVPSGGSRAMITKGR